MSPIDGDDPWSSSDDDDMDDEVEDECFSFHSICSYNFKDASSSPTFDSLAAALEYDVSNYGFDLLQHLLPPNHEDFYEGAIILVNKSRAFVRENCNGSVDKLEIGEMLNTYLKGEALTISSAGDEANMVYFRPQLEDDAMLMFIDELQALKGSQIGSNDDSPVMNTPSDNESVKQLQLKIELLEEQLSQAKKCIASFAMEENGEKSPSSSGQTKKLNAPDNDTYYFSSYSNTSIHETMLRDTVRTAAYESAILSNAESLFRDKTVMDIGCGTGVLSLFCAKAGARKVIAVDNSDILSQAKQIIELNGYGHVITCVHGKIESLIQESALPLSEGETVDIIVSEWMGYALFFETMLPSVLVARDALMTKVTGTMFPNVAKVFIEGANDQERLSYWDNVHGIDMKPMKQRMIEELTEEGLVQIVDDNKIITNRAEMIAFDLNTCKDEELDFEAPFKLHLRNSSSGNESKMEVHQLIVSFDIGFSVEGTAKASFSTGCQSPPTHWKQTVLWFDPLHNCPVLRRDENDIMKGKFHMRRNAKNHRAIDMAVMWETGHFRSENECKWERTGEGVLKRSLHA
ncbi:hypothetical protein HJC23_001372 [Cyclotella cryptica]|uniref:type I protein arginine methyltransferase n=1 Tax=Cyclotella cryptica TaxID=29204 RepID=A0ABD3NMI0_9STRA|eukprot:CCRYP_020412-RA/>CCRYP_020412-RA protein AED:0.39 eAED:0.39 QI:0/-1/0/1/-1/1/1/0/574